MEDRSACQTRGVQPSKVRPMAGVRSRSRNERRSKVAIFRGALETPEGPRGARGSEVAAGFSVVDFAVGAAGDSLCAFGGGAIAGVPAGVRVRSTTATATSVATAAPTPMPNQRMRRDGGAMTADAGTVARVVGGRRRTAQVGQTAPSA